MECRILNSQLLEVERNAIVVFCVVFFFVDFLISVSAMNTFLYSFIRYDFKIENVKIKAFIVTPVVFRFNQSSPAGYSNPESTPLRFENTSTVAKIMYCGAIVVFSFNLLTPVNLMLFLDIQLQIDLKMMVLLKRSHSNPE